MRPTVTKILDQNSHRYLVRHKVAGLADEWMNGKAFDDLDVAIADARDIGGFEGCTAQVIDQQDDDKVVREFSAA